MFDPNRFVELIKGGLLEADANAGAYRAENRNWQYTAFTLAGPLIVLSMIAAGLIAWLLNSGPQFGGFGLWLSLIHISEPTRLVHSSRMPSSA